MNGFLIALHVLVCFCIIFAVLLQVGRGAELGAAFGSMGQANASRGQASLMGKFTTVIAFLFMLTSFFLTYQTSNQTRSSVLEKVEAQESMPAPAPVEDAAQKMVPQTEPIEMPQGPAPVTEPIPGAPLNETAAPTAPTSPASPAH